MITKTYFILFPLCTALLSFAKLWQALPPTNIASVLQHAIHSWHLSRYRCMHEYTIEILSIDPFMIYINGFTTDFEIDHMLRVSKSDFGSSYVYNEKLESVIDTRYRTSQSSMIPVNDPIGQCLSMRLKSILGNVQHIRTEPIQVVKYEPTEKFLTHMDWFDMPRNLTMKRGDTKVKRAYNRLASIFAYLEDGCTGGETYFPNVQGVSVVADGDKFARTESGKGLLVRPKRGNAVFWNNLFANGTGDSRVEHAGLPVDTGTKIGINLFSYYFYDAPMFGGEEE